MREILNMIISAVLFFLAHYPGSAQLCTQHLRALPNARRLDLSDEKQRDVKKMKTHSAHKFECVEVALVLTHNRTHLQSEASAVQESRHSQLKPNHTHPICPYTSLLLEVEVKVF